MKKFALLALLGAAAAGAAAVCVKVIKDRKSNLDADYTECPCEGENPPQAPVQEPAQKPEGAAGGSGRHRKGHLRQTR